MPCSSIHHLTLACPKWRNDALRELRGLVFIECRRILVRHVVQLAATSIQRSFLLSVGILTTLVELDRTAQVRTDHIFCRLGLSEAVLALSAENLGPLLRGVPRPY